MYVFESGFWRESESIIRIISDIPRGIVVNPLVSLRNHKSLSVISGQCCCRSLSLLLLILVALFVVIPIPLMFACKIHLFFYKSTKK